MSDATKHDKKDRKLHAKLARILDRARDQCWMIYDHWEHVDPVRAKAAYDVAMDFGARCEAAGDYAERGK